MACFNQHEGRQRLTSLLKFGFNAKLKKPSQKQEAEVNHGKAEKFLPKSPNHFPMDNTCCGYGHNFNRGR
jgi:hypothetical protein